MGLTGKEVRVLDYIDNPDGSVSSKLKEIGQGTFQGWGMDALDHGSSYSVAIVVMQDGTVQTPIPNHIVFLERQERWERRKKMEDIGRGSYGTA